MFKKWLFIALTLYTSTISLSAQVNKTHTVKSGETITSICNEYGITKDELVKLNPTVKNYVYTGQVLNIPSKESEQPDSNTTGPTDTVDGTTVKSFESNDEVLDSKTYSSKEYSKSEWDLSYDGKFQFVSTNSLGVYLKPDYLSKIDDLHYLGLSLDFIDIGTRLNLSKHFFLQGTVSMQFDYSISWLKNTSGSGDYKMTVESRNSDANSTFGIPIHVGVNVGPFTLLGGVYGRVAWIGCQTTYNKTTTKNNENKESTFKYYKDIKKDNKDFDRITYGLSFAVTVKGKNHSSRGISFKTVTSEHSKESMKLISYVVYH